MLVIYPEPASMNEVLELLTNRHSMQLKREVSSLATFIPLL